MEKKNETTTTVETPAFSFVGTERKDTIASLKGGLAIDAKASTLFGEQVTRIMDDESFEDGKDDNASIGKGCSIVASLWLAEALNVFPDEDSAKARVGQIKALALKSLGFVRSATEPKARPLSVLTATAMRACIDSITGSGVKVTTKTLKELAYQFGAMGREDVSYSDLTRAITRTLKPAQAPKSEAVTIPAAVDAAA